MSEQLAIQEFLTNNGWKKFGDTMFKDEDGKTYIIRFTVEVVED